VFSTNGTATMGRLGIPTVGFAPGREELAHTTNEWVAVEDLVKATAVYSLIPHELAKTLTAHSPTTPPGGAGELRLDAGRLLSAVSCRL
jgi:hypothetical protein